MGWTSQDDLINDITVNGYIGRHDYNKLSTPAQVAGSWSDIQMLGGYPVTTTYAGTSLIYVPTDDTSAGAIWHGGSVGTAMTKHFLNAGATIFAAAGAPWIIMAVDQVGYIPITGTDVTGTATRTVTMTALDSTARWPDGIGLRAYFSTYTAPTAGGPNMTAFTYTNQAGTAARSVPVTVGFKTTPVATEVPHSGNAATRYGPFLPMAAGDYGIRDIETFRFEPGTNYTGSGVLVIHLVKPLWSLPIVASGMYTERDFLNQLPSLPKIPDGAHLKFLVYQTGGTSNNSPININFDYGWG